MWRAQRVCWLAALAVAAAQRSLLVHPDTDPHANEDPFLALTASELRRTWSHSSSEEEEHPAGAGGAGAGGAGAGAGTVAVAAVDDDAVVPIASFVGLNNCCCSINNLIFVS